LYFCTVNKVMDRKITEILSKIVSILAEELKPKRIFLFGSFARGDNHPESDLDIFIVTDLNNNKVEMTQRARRLLLRKIRLPVDILVCDTKVFESKKYNTSTLENLVATEGIELYGK
jgi:uncharacterized protein